MRIVIPSVDYADMLTATLPAWRRQFPDAQLVVVTSHRDRRTAAIARELGAGILVTDAWYRDGHAFNKARALDEAFNFAALEAGELCIAIDADVYPFGALELEALRAGVLYGCDRFYCETPAALERQIARPDRAHLDRMTAGRRGAGYFQAFRARPDLTFGSYPNAGYYDLAFHRHFAGGVAVLEGFYVLHLGRKSGKNWSGRTLPKWGAA
jgi:hypothetical protein